MSSATAQTPSTRWLVRRGSRIAALVLPAVLLVVGTLLATDGARVSDRITGVIMLVLGPTIYWAGIIRPYIEIAADTVVVQNPLRRYVIPLDHIERATAEYWGIMLRVRHRGRPVVAIAVQKSNLSTWRGRDDTRADQVVAEIRQAQSHRAR